MSRLTDWVAGLDRVAPGWDKDSWNAALRDTYACRDSVAGTRGRVERMVAFIECRRGKKVKKAGA